MDQVFVQFVILSPKENDDINVAYSLLAGAVDFGRSPNDGCWMIYSAIRRVRRT